MSAGRADDGRTLYEVLLDARDTRGGGAIVLAGDGGPMSYDQLLAATKRVGRVLKARSEPGEAVGLMLPDVAGAIVPFFALQGLGRIAVMLDASAGLASIDGVSAAASLRTIVTTRAVLSEASVDHAALAADGREIVFIEDIEAEAGAGARLRAWIGARFARALLRRRRLSPDAVAVILPAQGQDVAPETVTMTHRDLIHDHMQRAASGEISTADLLARLLGAVADRGGTSLQ